MNPLRAIGRALTGVGRVLLMALRFAETRGLTDELVDLALKHVLHAGTAFEDNEQRRAYVLDKLKRKGVPENIAYWALAAAVELYKQQVKP